MRFDAAVFSTIVFLSKNTNTVRWAMNLYRDGFLASKLNKMSRRLTH